MIGWAMAHLAHHTKPALLDFESTILKQTLQAFGVDKSHTTPYHPQGDGMVEHFIRSLL